jgi:hypothetical protein
MDRYALFSILSPLGPFVVASMNTVEIHDDPSRVDWDAQEDDDEWEDVDLPSPSGLPSQPLGAALVAQKVQATSSALGPQLRVSRGSVEIDIAGSAEASASAAAADATKKPARAKRRTQEEVWIP